MSNFRNAIVAGMAALATLALVEIGMRMAGVKFEPSLYQPDPVLYATWRPNAAGWTVEEGENFVRINGLGMRDRERTVSVLASTFRIAVLGDSFMAAQQVPLHDIATQVLERDLNGLVPDGKRVEVLNFAVGGYALSQMAMLLDRKVWMFQPDVVMVVVSTLTVPNAYRKTKSLGELPFFSLDGDRLVPDRANAPPHPSSESLERHRIFGDLLNEFRLLGLVRAAQQSDLRTIFSLQRARPPNRAVDRRPADFMNAWAYRAPAPNSNLLTAWKITEATLRSMIEDTRRHGREFWLVQIGGAIEEEPDESLRNAFLKANSLENFDYATDRYRELARSEGIGFVALAPGMRQYSESHDVRLRGFFNTPTHAGHWNEHGNAVAARLIEQRLSTGSAAFARFIRSDGQ